MDGISVIVPCYNASATLAAALDSIVSQRVDCPVEVLVGDDGSRDDSVAVASRFGPRVRVLRHPGGANRGVSATRNLCIAESSHPYLALLDSDDLWLPGHLSGLLAALRARPDAVMAYGNGGYLLGDEVSVSSRFPDGHEPVTPEAILADCKLITCCVLLRKESVVRVGGFLEGLRAGEDQDLWLRLLETGPSVYVPRRTCLYRLHPNQTTGEAHVWEGAARVLERAVARRPYPAALVNRRRAVLAYRTAQSALRQGAYLRALTRLGRAAWLAPEFAARALLARDYRLASA